MPVTMTQIARRTKLSPATVSRVLNNKADKFISAATRARVLKAAEEMGYQPNRLARGLVTGRTQIMALWARALDRPYYASIVRAVHELSSENGYQLLLHGVSDAAGAEDFPGAHRLTTEGFWPVDGVLAADCPAMVEAYLRANPGKPLVTISNDVSPGVDFVGFDTRAGVKAAVEHLLQIGCQRIAHLSGGRAIPQVRSTRAGGYIELIRGAGRNPEIINADEDTRSAARTAVARHVEQHGPPDGLYCMNDELAIGAYRALRDLKLQVPQDVAIVGCDGIPDAEFLDVTLSTVQHPVRELCRRAWELLRQRMADESAPVTREVLEPKLIVRESSARTAGVA